jgi:hypothetical protein
MENLRDMNIKHNMSTCDLVQVHGGSRGMVIHPMMGIPFQIGISIGIMVIYIYVIYWYTGWWFQPPEKY